MEWNRIKEKVLKRYAPTEEELEETQNQYHKISELIQREFELETHFAGSASRGTCMRGDKDIDIFVLFPEDISRRELEEKGLEIGKKVFHNFNADYNVEYAEHPYTKGEIDGHEIEIVPCYDTSPKNIKSAVDRTPHHSRWVENNLSKDQRDEVILLKTFLRTQGLYGSSLKIEGFSGYLTEILISEYGSFDKLASAAVKWGRKQFIDPEDHHNGELPEELENKFEEDSLIVVDPVDPERNVAAVLSTENYAKFIYSCWQFRQDPGMHFFEEGEEDFSEFELKQELDKRADLLVLEFDLPDEVDDIVYPQMRKTLRRITQKLEDNEFRAFEKGFYVNEKVRIFFELDQELPKVREVRGPKVFHGEEHIAQFRSKYDNVFIKDDRLYAKTDREYTDAKRLLKDFLKDDLEQKGIPEHIAEKMEEYSFIDPLEADREWLKYLAEKLHV